VCVCVCVCVCEQVTIDNPSNVIPYMGCWVTSKDLKGVYPLSVSVQWFHPM